MKEGGQLKKAKPRRPMRRRWPRKEGDQGRQETKATKVDCKKKQAAAGKQNAAPDFKVLAARIFVRFSWPIY